MKHRIPPILAVLVLCVSLRGAQLVTFTALPTNTISVAGLVIGADGNYYGALENGGENGLGGIFEVTTNGSYFLRASLTKSIGSAPDAPLIRDAAGNLYGTASGYNLNNGTVFMFASDGTLSLFGTFRGTNGAGPMGPLLLVNGVLFGTTEYGGSNGFGSVFKITNSGEISDIGFFNQTNGAYPISGLVRGANGLLYGTAPAGGRLGAGDIFQITNGTIRTVASLTQAEGDYAGPLTLGSDGDLYGVTSSGPNIGRGTIFKATPSGRVSVLHQFEGPDGDSPNGPLLRISDGRLLGTTESGGPNNLGTFFSITTNGSFVMLGSFNGTNGSLPIGGLIEGADGNFYGTAIGLSNSGTIFQFGSIAPEIVTEPSAPIWASNHTAVLSVAATGTQPLSFQWFFDNTAISGETNAALTVSNESLASIGTYSVSVSNSYGVTNVQTFLDAAAPTVTLDALPASVTNSALLAQGTASGRLGIESVQLSLNGAAPSDTSIISTNQSHTNWSETLMLAPGSNILQAVSVDPYGETSKPVRMNIFYRAPGQFTWVTEGFGKINASEKTNGILVIDRPLTLTAVPEARNIFAGWTITSDGVVTNSFTNPLTLLMPANVIVEADFTTNFFAGLAGNYAGLFYNPTNITPQTAGMARGIVVGQHGAVSGKLILGGQAYLFSGAFNGAGFADIVAKASQTEALNLQMTLSENATNLTGIVQSITSPSPWTASLTAGLVSTAKESNQFTMLIPPEANNPSAPPGYGYAVGNIQNSVATLSGASADGASFSETGPILVNNSMFPLYANIDNGAGLLIGWLNFANGAPQGQVWYVKQASPIGLFYHQGFTNVVSVQSSLWTNPPPNQAAVDLTSLTFDDGGLGAPINFYIVVNSKNQILNEGTTTNSLTGAINPKNGVLRVTLGNGPGKETTAGVGAVLQNSNSAGGFFLGAASGGSITSP